MSTNEEQAVMESWAARLGPFAATFFQQTPALQGLLPHCAVVLHGSTTRGIDDAFSDLDLWVLLPRDALMRAESVAGTRFFSFVLQGKKGHFNLEAIEEASGRVSACDLERIAEWRTARILLDVDNMAHTLAAQSRQPMRDDVRHAWFCHHYIEMRGYHRNCDNPMERGDQLAVLLGLVPTLNHALRAAMVLDREPYPYIKWLGQAARSTPTGQRIMPLVEDILHSLTAGALTHSGPESGNPISIKLRDLRQLLVERARDQGIHEPWLERWWVHMTQAAEGIRLVRWIA